ncbi:MAG: GNAT family N-acetyltransferase [Pirellulaceae bacterium]
MSSTLSNRSPLERKNLLEQGLRTTPASQLNSLVQIAPARTGDHPAIHRFLMNVFQCPSGTDYAAQLEDPYYEPTDRIVARLGSRIVGHARVQFRDMRFGPVTVPIAWLTEMAIAPEFRGQNIGSTIFEKCEHLMREQGACVGVLTTSKADFFKQCGWAVGIRHSFSTALPRNILSYIREYKRAEEGKNGNNPLIEKGLPIKVRIWRHVEQDALVRLYDNDSEGAFGAYERTDAYWRWLLNRQSFDQIYVAVEGLDKLNLETGFDAIKGYAVVKGARIIEMMAEDNREDIILNLLERICGDVIEQNDQPVRLDAAATSPVHEVFRLSGGKFNDTSVANGQVFITKAFDPINLLESVRPVLSQQARNSSLNTGDELGIQVGDKKVLISINQRSIKISTGKLGRSYITCTPEALTQLLLGFLDVEDAISHDHIQVSTRLASELAIGLFKRLPVWLPPLNDLLA